MTPKKCFVILDINTVQQYFDGTPGWEKIKMGKRMFERVRRIFAWSRLRRVPVISIVPQPTQERPCKKLKCARRNDCEVFEAINNTDRPKPHDQLIFCSRSENPLDEPRIHRILSEIKDREIIATGIGKAITNTVIGLLNNGKKVTVLVDAVRFPDSIAEKEIRKMETKGAMLTTTVEFGEHRSYSQLVGEMMSSKP